MKKNIEKLLVEGEIKSAGEELLKVAANADIEIRKQLVTLLSNINQSINEYELGLITHDIKSTVLAKSTSAIVSILNKLELSEKKQEKGSQNKSIGDYIYGDKVMGDKYTAKTINIQKRKK